MSIEDERTSKHRIKKRGINKHFKRLLATAIVLLSIVGLLTISIPPQRAFGGAVWLKHGVHYISDAQISARTEQIIAPKETVLANRISKNTPTCDSLNEGLCQRSLGEYADKFLITPAVDFKPGTPDTKVIIGYCTVCNDGTFSPSCAVGRGACSWHGGVAAYNVARYRTIPGTPEVQAQPAVYSFEPKTYKDSPNYTSPIKPTLKEVTGY